MFNDLKISTRLVGAFTLLVFMLLAIGALSVMRTMAVQTDLVDITERRMKVIADMELVRNETNLQARAIRNIALLADPTKVAQEKQSIADSRVAVDKMTAELDSLVISTKSKEIQAQLGQARKPFDDSVDRFIALIDRNERDPAIALLFETVRPLQLTYMNAIDEAVSYEAAGAQAASQSAQSVVKHG